MQKNRIELAGYLAAKPEVRYLPSGTPVANARLAEGYRTRTGMTRSRSTRTGTALFSTASLSEIAVSFDKGDNIFVEGTLQTRKFTPRDGSQRTVYEVVARSVHQIVRRNRQRNAVRQRPAMPRSRRVPEPAETCGGVADDGEIWPS